MLLALTGTSSFVQRTRGPTKCCPRQNSPAPTQTRRTRAQIDSPAPLLCRAPYPLSTMRHPFQSPATKLPGASPVPAPTKLRRQLPAQPRCTRSKTAAPRSPCTVPVRRVREQSSDIRKKERTMPGCIAESAESKAGAYLESPRESPAIKMSSPSNGFRFRWRSMIAECAPPVFTAAEIWICL
jgi:hypothetical protein